jgi:hypothetical protein
MLYHRLPDGARAHAVSTYVTTTAGRSGRARGLEKRALRPICEDTRNAVRARVRLCPTACPTRREFPMVKPDQSGIIIRVSGVRVPPPASEKSLVIVGFAEIEHHLWRGISSADFSSGPHYRRSRPGAGRFEAISRTARRVPRGDAGAAREGVCGAQGECVDLLIVDGQRQVGTSRHPVARLAVPAALDQHRC